MGGRSWSCEAHNRIGFTFVKKKTTKIAKKVVTSSDKGEETWCSHSIVKLAYEV